MEDMLARSGGLEPLRAPPPLAPMQGVSTANASGGDIYGYGSSGGGADAAGGGASSTAGDDAGLPIDVQYPHRCRVRPYLKHFTPYKVVLA